MATILNAEPVLRAFVSKKEFSERARGLSAANKANREKVKRSILSETFRTNLEKALAIIEPIDAWIKHFQSDSVPISEVARAFHELPNNFRELSDKLNETQLDYLIKETEKQYQFMWGDAHGFGNVLDPRYMGMHLDERTGDEIEKSICKFPDMDGKPASEERMKHLEKEFLDYSLCIAENKAKRKSGIETNTKFDKVCDKKVSVLEWWVLVGDKWPTLKTIAIQVFTMVPSTASAERGFSSMGFIHSKLRNYLKPVTINKLVFIKSNYSLIGEKYSEDADNEYYEDAIEK
jgi:hypothetical protein